MRIVVRVVLACCIALVCRGAIASISSVQQLKIDLTNSADASAKADWSTPEAIAVTKDGLGWEGEGAASRDGWIQTKPLAIGLSWRPTYSAHIRVAIAPLPLEITLPNGQKSTPDAGDVYARYSPDLMHWSSWQVLERSQPRSVNEKKTPARYYEGQIRVTNREREAYNKLISEYSRLDVPWKSDEEAAVQWILARDPVFFSKQIPFIGYVELLYEGSFRGGQRIRSLQADVTWMVGGEHYPPKDPASEKGRDSSPWKYKADETSLSTTADEKEKLWQSLWLQLIEGD